MEAPLLDQAPPAEAAAASRGLPAGGAALLLRHLGIAVSGGDSSPVGAPPENLFSPEVPSNAVLEVRKIEGSEGFFNATPVTIQGEDHLLGRQVMAASPEGEPDRGLLVMAKLGSDGNIVSVQKLWDPKGQDELYEDPRAYQTDDNRMSIGFTTVVESAGHRPYPSFVKLDSAEDLLTKPFPRPRIVAKEGGDQATPIGEPLGGKNATILDQGYLMYRPDGEDHALRVLKQEDEYVTDAGKIEFPTNIPWADLRIGTVGAPVWLNNHEAVLPFHGITIDGDGIPVTEGGTGKYIYSIGTCRLTRRVGAKGRVTFSVDNISKEPVITPDTFQAQADDPAVELHNKRRVAYSCGGKVTRDEAGQPNELGLYVNQGDRRTWLVRLGINEITSTWNRSEQPTSSAA